MGADAPVADLTDLEFQYHELLRKEEHRIRDTECALPVFSLFDNDILPLCRTSQKRRSTWAALFPKGERDIPNDAIVSDPSVSTVDVAQTNVSHVKRVDSDDVLARSFWEGKEALARLVVFEMQKSQFGPGSDCYSYIVTAAQKLVHEKSMRTEGISVRPDAAIKHLLNRVVSEQPPHVLASLNDKETVEMVNSILERLPTTRELDAECADRRIKSRIRVATTPVSHQVHFKSIAVLKSFN